MIVVSGTFARDDGEELPSSTTVFVYVENIAHPDDFVRGHQDFVLGHQPLDPSTGEFSVVVIDIPEGSSRVFLAFVVVDPEEAVDPAEPETVFAVDVYNPYCPPSLAITYEYARSFYDVELVVTEPGGTTVFYAGSTGVSEALIGA